MEVSYRVIGRNLKRARVARGLTQGQAAERIGCTPLHYGRLERGERPASLSTLAAAAEAFGVPVERLLLGAFLGGNAPADGGADGRAAAERIAACARGCSERAQALMLSLCLCVERSDKAGEREEAPRLRRR